MYVFTTSIGEIGVVTSVEGASMLAAIITYYDSLDHARGVDEPFGTIEVAGPNYRNNRRRWPDVGPKEE